MFQSNLIIAIQEHNNHNQLIKEVRRYIFLISLHTYFVPWTTQNKCFAKKEKRDYFKRSFTEASI